MRRFAPLLVLVSLLAPVVGIGASSAGAVSAAALPTVKGGFDQQPSITFPNAKAPSKLTSKVLHQGSGAKVLKGQLLVANYLGQIWRGKVFDSSFSRDQLSGFPIGVGEVIPGWDKTLVGARLGSEMLLVVPPADGYGSAGNTGAGITGTDTLVFVVDLVAAYGANAVASANATAEHATVGGVTVSGKVDAAPKVTIAKNAPKPKSVTTTLLAKGHGAPIKPGLVIFQLLQVDWTGQTVASTWQLKTPYGGNVKLADEQGIFDAVAGQPLGSRFLIELPEVSSEGPYALVADAVAEPHDGAA